MARTPCAADRLARNRFAVRRRTPRATLATPLVSILLAHHAVANWQVALLVLVAVLVGALIPVLLQLRATLRAVERAVKTTVPRVDETLVDVSKLLVDVSQVVESVQSTTRVVGAIGAAIGPAIVAGVRSYRAAREESEAEEENHEPRAGVEDRA